MNGDPYGLLIGVRNVITQHVSGRSSSKGYIYENTGQPLFKDSSLQNDVLDPAYHPKKGSGTHEEGTHGPDFTLSPLNLDFDLNEDKFSKILVIYTGGTIGMKNVNGVLCPIPHFFVSILRNMPMFHDSDYASSIGLQGQSSTEPLIMPEGKDGKRIMYCVYEYDPVLDSCNITMTDWMKIANDIKHYYDHFDGYVVLHGTDTMAYSSSALSFLLEDLGKPVVFTGSQIPIFEIRSDGRDNFLGALIMAGSYCVPEVMVYFNNTLMRGCRVIKQDAGAFNAFVTPNMRPLAELGIEITVNWDAVFRPQSLSKLDVAKYLCPHVGILRFFPSITESTIRQFLAPPMMGIVLQSYGAGNGPSARQDLLKVFREACDNGMIIVNITQCMKGAVSVSYAAGKALSDVGIMPGGDMTPEAALTKLAYVLGKEDWDVPTKRKMMGMNLRGEMSVIQEDDDNECKLIDIPLLTKLKDVMGMASVEEVKLLRKAVYPSLLCSASQEGNILALEKLKEAGAVFTSPDYDGRTALHIACSEGHMEVVSFLLQNGALVHARDRYGISPLQDAIAFNHHDIIKLLVQTGAHLTIHPFKLGIELCLASAKNLPERLESYAQAGVDMNQGDYDGRTALHVAACQGYSDCIKVLLANGADKTKKDNFGRTPPEEAARLEHGDAIVNLFKD